MSMQTMPALLIVSLFVGLVWFTSNSGDCEDRLKISLYKCEQLTDDVYVNMCKKAITLNYKQCHDTKGDKK